MEELKHCPFCGGNNIHYSSQAFPPTETPWEITHYCKPNKNKIILYGRTKQEVTDVWNSRVENTELKFTREFIHRHGLEFELASEWAKRNK